MKTAAIVAAVFALVPGAAVAQESTDLFIGTAPDEGTSIVGTSSGLSTFGLSTFGTSATGTGSLAGSTGTSAPFSLQPTSSSSSALPITPSTALTLPPPARPSPSVLSPTAAAPSALSPAPQSSFTLGGSGIGSGGGVGFDDLRNNDPEDPFN